MFCEYSFVRVPTVIGNGTGASKRFVSTGIPYVLQSIGISTYRYSLISRIMRSQLFFVRVPL
jgi:hypothetical protein